MKYHQNPFKFIMLNLFYPAFLGTIIYQAVEKLANMPKNYIASGHLFTQLFTGWHAFKLAIMLLMVFHYILDFGFLQSILEDKITDEKVKITKYNILLFLIDIIVLFCFPLVFPSLSLHKGIYWPFFNPFVLFAATYILFAIWVNRFFHLNPDHAVIKDSENILKIYNIITIGHATIAVLYWISTIDRMFLGTKIQFDTLKFFGYFNFFFIVLLIITCILIHCCVIPKIHKAQIEEETIYKS